MFFKKYFLYHVLFYCILALDLIFLFSAHVIFQSRAANNNSTLI